MSFFGPMNIGLPVKNWRLYGANDPDRPEAFDPLALDENGTHYREIVVYGYGAQAYADTLEAKIDSRGLPIKVYGGYEPGNVMRAVNALPDHKENAVIVVLNGVYDEKPPVFNKQAWSGAITIAGLNNKAGKVPIWKDSERRGWYFFFAYHQRSIVRNLVLDGCGVDFAGYNGNSMVADLVVANFGNDGVHWGMPPEDTRWHDAQPDYYLDENGVGVGIQRDVNGNKFDQLINCEVYRCGQGNVKHNVYHSGRDSNLIVDGLSSYAPKGSICFKAVPRAVVLCRSFLSFVDSFEESSLTGKYCGRAVVDVSAAGERLFANNIIICGNGHFKSNGRHIGVDANAVLIRARRTIMGNDYPIKPTHPVFQEPGYWAGLLAHPHIDRPERGLSDGPQMPSYFFNNAIYRVDLEHLGGVNYPAAPIRNDGTAPLRQAGGRKWAKGTEYLKRPHNWPEFSVVYDAGQQLLGAPFEDEFEGDHVDKVNKGGKLVPGPKNLPRRRRIEIRPEQIPVPYRSYLSPPRAINSK